LDFIEERKGEGSKQGKGMDGKGKEGRGAPSGSSEKIS